MIKIIDYGMGNLGSIHNMFKHIGVESVITDDLGEIKSAKKLLLPGVGSFDKAMRRINEMGLREVLDEKAHVEKIPVMGICLGMQLLTGGSEEGNEKGLDWIEADTVKFRFENNHYKIPHMGWNLVHPQKQIPLIDDLPEEPRFYFVHSYYVKVKNEENTLLKTTYGDIEFDSGIVKDNIFGLQFHPEKSHKFGMKLFENFAKI